MMFAMSIPRVDSWEIHYQQARSFVDHLNMKEDVLKCSLLITQFMCDWTIRNGQFDLFVGKDFDLQVLLILSSLHIMSDSFYSHY